MVSWSRSSWYAHLLVWYLSSLVLVVLVVSFVVISLVVLCLPTTKANMLPTSKATCMQHEHPRDARVESTGCSERVCRARLSQMCQRQASRSQPVASELSIMPLDVSACCGVRISAAPATLARVQRAVWSALCTRVLVCKAQRSERGRGSGEAKPGARYAFLRLHSVLR